MSSNAGKAEIMTYYIAVPMRSYEPEFLQESNQVRQPVEGKKERVEDYKPESSLTDSFMNLVDFVQPAKIFFEDEISGRQQHTPAE